MLSYSLLVFWEIDSVLGVSISLLVPRPLPMRARCGLARDYLDSGSTRGTMCTARELVILASRGPLTSFQNDLLL
jgi:hypothetical protein